MKEFVELVREMRNLRRNILKRETKMFEPKDGDVVYTGGFYDFVFIYKDNLTEEAFYYASLNLKTNEIELPDGVI